MKTVYSIIRINDRFLINLGKYESAVIEIKKERDNTYKFSLKSSEGYTLLDSVGFTSKEEVKKTVERLRVTKHQTTFERRTDHNGKFLFRLKDKSGNIIGDSLLYGSEAGMENGIENLKKSIASLSNLDSL